MSIFQNLFLKFYHYTCEQVGAALASQLVDRQSLDMSLMQCKMVGDFKETEILEVDITALHIFLCDIAIFFTYGNTSYRRRITDEFCKRTIDIFLPSMEIEIKNKVEVYSSKLKRLDDLLGDPKPSEIFSEISSTFCEMIGCSNNYKMFLVVEKNIVPFVFNMAMSMLEKAKLKK